VSPADLLGLSNNKSCCLCKGNPLLLSYRPARSNISGATLSSHLICDIVVSNAQAGAVIGRQGSHIKTIMAKSRALVAVSYRCICMLHTTSVRVDVFIEEATINKHLPTAGFIHPVDKLL